MISLTLSSRRSGSMGGAEVLAARDEPGAGVEG
jgi:hypothetical protein